MTRQKLYQQYRHPLLCAAVAMLVAGCGGGGGGTSSSGGSQSAGTAPPATSSGGVPISSEVLPAPVGPDLSQPVLPVPANIVNGATVVLECGRTYQGTLDLRGKSDVTVRAAGDCGKPVLTPGQAVSGWSRHQGNIYSAPVSFDVAQVLINAQPVSRAHWPSREQTWVKATGASTDSLSYAMPNADLVGATLIFRAYDWAIEARKITGYSGTSMALATIDDLNYGGYALSGAPEFYVEGKLWMLDQPGEWALDNGRLYVWAADGQSPAGRIWASPAQHGIDAANSQRVSIDGIRVYGAANGVHAPDAASVRVTNGEITNSSGSGIFNSGGSGLMVDGTTIRNARHDGIVVKWGGGNERISNSRVDAAGSIGMPVNAHAAISLNVADGSSVTNNHVTNSGYIGIRVFRNASVSKNTVDTACLVLTDCGGIYVMARDRQPLNTRIEENTVRNVGPTQKLAWAIWLDDSANAVTVAGNTVSGSGNGLMIHNGFDNAITGNTFSSSRQAHVQMAESVQDSVRRNRIVGNSFTVTGNQETYRLSSDFGATAVGQFGSYDDNRYTSASSIFANFNGEALSFADWRSRTGQDGASSFAVGSP